MIPWQLNGYPLSGYREEACMNSDPDRGRTLAAWNRIPSRIRAGIRGLQDADLDLRGGADGWSIRETVHHIIEANLVASNMIIAALATNGGNFDWTWVSPDQAWMCRVGYDKADVRPGINALGALTRYVSILVTSRRDAFTRTVHLNDAPGARRYPMTIEQILLQEIDHAKGHLAGVRTTRRQHGR